MQNHWLCLRRVRTVGALLALLAVSVLSCGAEEMKTTQMAAGNVVVRAQCVGSTNGSTVGFRVEVINRDVQTNVVLVIQDKISIFDVRLINAKGQDISLMPEDPVLYKRRSGRDEGCRYEKISPGTSHSWFVPVPKQVRIDCFKPVNLDNTKTTPDGNFTAMISITVSYFLQDMKDTQIPAHPVCRPLHLSLPGISVVTDQDSIGKDVLKTYIEGNRMRAERERTSKKMEVNK